MKRYFNLLIILSSLLIVVSCSLNEDSKESYPDPKGLRIYLNTRTERDKDRSNEDASITTIRAMLFANEELIRQQIFGKSDLEGKSYIEVKGIRKKESPNTIYRIVLVINEPDRIEIKSFLDKINNSGELYATKLSYFISEVTNSYLEVADRGLPMWGEIAFDVSKFNNEISGRLYPKIERLVSKINLNFKVDDDLNVKFDQQFKIVFSNLPSGAFLQSDGPWKELISPTLTPFKGDEIIHLPKDGNLHRIVSFYIPYREHEEQAVSQIQLKGITINGARNDYEKFNLGNSPQFIIPKNTIGDLNIALKSYLMPEVAFNLLPWEEIHKEYDRYADRVREFTFNKVDYERDVLAPVGGAINVLFENPFNDPVDVILYEISREGSKKRLTEQKGSADTITITIPALIAGVNHSRQLQICYKHEGVEYKAKSLYQRISNKLKILSVGYEGLFDSDLPWQPDGTEGEYNIYLGTAKGNAITYIDGLWPLLKENFTNKGKLHANKFEYEFQFYTLYNGQSSTYGRDFIGKNGKSIGALLKEYEIDILFLPFDEYGTPTAEQAHEILDWLDGKDLNLPDGMRPNRGLVLNADYLYANRKVSTNRSLIAAMLNLSQTLSYTVPYPFHWGNGTSLFRLSQANDPAYQAIIETGPFGNLTGKSFKAVDNDYGWIRPDLLPKNGFVPIFIDGNNQAVIAVNSDRHIYFQGETQFFQHWCLYKDGSIDNERGPSNKGPYPKMIGNLWAYLLDKVVLGAK